MKLIPQLYVAAGLLMSIALVSVGTTLWIGQQAAFDLERTDLANRNYESYLELSSATYQLLMEFRAASGAGQTLAEGEAELRAKITNELALIRDLTAREIQLVGEEEFEELGRLSAIERAIDSLIRQHSRRLAIANGVGAGDDVPNAADERFDALIKEALADEASEVADARMLTAQQIARSEAVAIGFGIVAVSAAILGLLLLGRGIRGPIQKLLVGVQAFGDGNLGYRIAVAGHNELEDVGRAFNQMAQELALREQALSRSNERLENAVSERTGELKRALAKLTESEANRRRMLADVSHELRTPLTIIRGEAEVALRGGEQPPDVYREALVKTRDAAKHTARLVDDLLFVARHESDNARLDVNDVDLADLLPDVVDECRTLTAGNGREVDLVNIDGPAMVRGDGDRIRQVVIILLENALRYGGASVHVRLDPTPAGYAVSVADDGPGMTAAELDRAFDRFFRGSNAGDRYASGSGLGLPVAKAIVEAHGGDIALRGGPGEGLTATFTIPKRTPLKAVS